MKKSEAGFVYKAGSCITRNGGKIKGFLGTARSRPFLFCRKAQNRRDPQTRDKQPYAMSKINVFRRQIRRLCYGRDKNTSAEYLLRRPNRDLCYDKARYASFPHAKK